MKFGEILINEGIITGEQLSAALERQVIFGGRLGTNLVELGLLKEEELTKYLGKYLNIQVVERKELDEAPREALDAITPEVALKYNVIPFKKEKKRLFVATFDALKIEILDEFRFKTGYDVIPHIVSEIRFMYALEKHYGIKRDIRFISVIDDLEEQEAISEVFSAPSRTETVKGSPHVQIQADGKEESSAHAEVSVDAAIDISQVKSSLINVIDKDEIAQILINEGAKVAARRAIFVVKGNMLEGWKGDNIHIDSFAVAIDPTSIFSQVINDKTFYRGPMAPTPGNNAFSSILGSMPQDCVIIPVLIRDRVVAVIYADNGNNNVLSGNINYLNGLASLASLSLEILILKKRITDSNLPAG